MDAGSIVSAILLAVTLVAYVYLTLAEGVYVAKHNGMASTLTRLPGLIRFLRPATIMASTASLIILFYTIGSLSVYIVSLGLLLLLLALWLVQGLTALALRRWPVVASLVATPLDISALNGPRNHSSSGDSAPPATIPLMANEETFLTDEQKAILDAREQRMIRSILSLEQDTVREIMRPRIDVVAVEKGAAIADVAKLMLESGHSRLPVYEGSIDRVVGVIYARDVLKFLGQEGPLPPLEQVMRPPFFIPESKRLDQLLQEFQSSRFQMAIVVDEYGGTEGIVTLEDLLEEIVGEIEDEFSQEEPDITLLEDGGALVDARVTLDDLNDVMGTQLAMEGIDTIGGFVSGSLGRLARTGDIINVDNVRIEVVAAVGRRLRRLRITRPNQQTPDTLTK